MSHHYLFCYKHQCYITDYNEILILRKKMCSNWECMNVWSNDNILWVTIDVCESRLFLCMYVDYHSGSVVLIWEKLR